MITILILQLDGTILQDKHQVIIKRETNWQEEVVVRCSEEGDKLIEKLATHTWEKPQGWYMNDDSGRRIIGFMY
tara:strand:- start:387 stop:608 length:222 start_codon:yes stop_codon:yes gene_type:complete